MAHDFYSPDIIIGFIILGCLVIACTSSILVSQPKLRENFLICRQTSNNVIIIFGYVHSFVIRHWNSFAQNDGKDTISQGNENGYDIDEKIIEI